MLPVRTCILRFHYSLDVCVYTELCMIDFAQGDFEFEDPNNHYGYIAYLAVLVIWEVIPTYLIVIFFRIKMPSASVVSCMDITNLLDGIPKLQCTLVQ